MTIKVTKNTSLYSVKVQGIKEFKVSVSGEKGYVDGNLTDLQDFDTTGVQDGYVVMYDAATGKYVVANPDEVLSNSADDGLPSSFVDKLDVDLDNKIDLDAGTF